MKVKSRFWGCCLGICIALIIGVVILITVVDLLFNPPYPRQGGYSFPFPPRTYDNTYACLRTISYAMKGRRYDAWSGYGDASPTSIVITVMSRSVALPFVAIYDTIFLSNDQAKVRAFYDSPPYWYCFQHKNWEQFQKNLDANKPATKDDLIRIWRKNTRVNIYENSEKELAINLIIALTNANRELNIRAMVTSYIEIPQCDPRLFKCAIENNLIEFDTVKIFTIKEIEPHQSNAIANIDSMIEAKINLNIVNKSNQTLLELMHKKMKGYKGDNKKSKFYMTLIKKLDKN